MPGGRAVDGYTLNGTSPGPEIRAQQGDLVEVSLVNESVTAGATLHWHGIDVPNAADGVAGITQDAVPVGGRHVYRFEATDPGTYWYHSHQMSHEQVVRGLLGAIVIVPATPPAHGADADVTVVDRTNHHLFQPLLYQVAAGILPPGLIAPALRSIIKKQTNAHALLAEVMNIDLAKKEVSTEAPDGRTLTMGYDTLVVAATDSQGTGVRDLDLQWDRRSALGVVPSSRRTIRVMWAWSEKPRSAASRARSRSPSASRSSAALTRRR